MTAALRSIVTILIIGLVIGGAFGIKYVINKVYFANHIEENIKVADDQFNNKLDRVTNDVTAQVIAEQDTKDDQSDVKTKNALDALDKVLKNAKDIPKDTRPVAVSTKRATVDAAPAPTVPATTAPARVMVASATTVQSVVGMWDYYCSEFPEQASCSKRGAGSSKMSTK